jgi:hypothetical protein
VACTQLLVQRGADAAAKNGAGKTPSDVAKDDATRTAQLLP